MNLRQFRVLPAVAVVLLASGCGKGTSAHGGPQSSMPPAAVDVVVAHPRSVELTRDVVGRLAPTKVAEVRARVTGIVLKRAYTEGAAVKPGELLFQIDPAPLKATLQVQQAALAQAQANQQNAQDTAARDKKLHTKGLISPQELDNAVASERTSAAAVRQAQANIELAKLNLSYAEVTAPIAGIAEVAQVTEGALVSQSAATPLTTVTQIDPLYVNFSLPAGAVGQLQGLSTQQESNGVGAIRVTLDDGTAYSETGKLDYVGPTVNTNTGTVALRGLIPNPDRRLLPGMFVNLKVVVGRLPNAFVLPQAAVQRDGQGAYVLTVGSDGKVAQARVETRDLQGGDWVVTGPLQDGQQVIVEGVQKAHPGATVKPRPLNTAPQPAAPHA